MDVINRAIMNGRHLTKNVELGNQTWSEFAKNVKNRKIFLFGLGEGANFFFETRNKDEIVLSGVIDNDNRKQGIRLEKYFPSMLRDDEKDVIIQDVSCLEQYKDEEIAILITSMLHYEEIYMQLIESSKTCNFSLLVMESNKRKRESSKDRACDVGMERKERVDDKKIVFYTMGGYSGHGKYIAEQVLKLRNDLDIVWLVRYMSVEIPDGIRLVYWYNQDKVIEELSTSKLIIIDDNILGDFVKRDEQIVVQVKHWSSITLKTFGIELANYRKQYDLAEKIRREIMQTDYVLTGSDFDTRTFRKAYEYSGEIVEVGSPRTDILFCADIIKRKVYNEYDISLEEKLILYAPTFRLDKNTGVQNTGEMLAVNFNEVIKSFEKRFGGRWKMLLRLHPNVAYESYKINKAGNIIDASDYSDSQELVAAVDAVITDYSSIMFEPAFVKKPVFLFAPDRREYIDGERELLISYDSLPFSIAETDEELIRNIKEFDIRMYETRVMNFLEQNGVHEDGCASERAAKFVLSILDR